MPLIITDEMKVDARRRLDTATKELIAFIRENKTLTFENLIERIREKYAELDKKYDVEFQLTLPEMKKPEAPRVKLFSSDTLGQATFDDFVQTFVQRSPRYVVKAPCGGTWRTRQKTLCDMPVKAHLSGKYDVGVLGKWYPEYSIIDIDSQPRAFVDKIRDVLNLDEYNSMLFSSESPGSYHLLLKPRYNGNPPTVRLLKNIFENIGNQYGLEIYPKARKSIRLPFGPKQKPLDESYAHLTGWKSNLYWFLKLNDFDLSTVKNHQMFFDFDPVGKFDSLSSVFEEGSYLLKNGLQAPSTREESQFKILYYLWRLNVSKSEAENVVWDWILTKHNGYSKDIISCPRNVQSHILRQSSIVFDKYEAAYVYPDSTHNTHHGYITKLDIPEIVEAAGASLPRTKFLFNLVKYSYPRRYRSFISIHRDRLVKWGSTETYLKYLGELENKGIIKRGKAYSSGQFSKDLKLNWQYRSSKSAVLYDGRAIETLESTVKHLYKPDEFRQLLNAKGAERTTAYKATKTVFNV